MEIGFDIFFRGYYIGRNNQTVFISYFLYLNLWELRGCFHFSRMVHMPINRWAVCLVSVNGKRFSLQSRSSKIIFISDCFRCYLLGVKSKYKKNPFGITERKLYKFIVTFKLLCCFFSLFSFFSCFAVTVAFLPKRLLNLSIRPAVSTNTFLPV